MQNLHQPRIIIMLIIKIYQILTQALPVNNKIGEHRIIPPHPEFGKNAVSTAVKFKKAVGISVKAEE